MSQIPLTNSERVAALGCLGYTEREATFLCMAALHSGYFLRRQYRDFLAQNDGGVVAQLIEKARERQHIQVFTYHRKIQIYHLGARPFYAALGQSDNRNRRRHEPVTIKSRVMALDFVIAHRDYHYLATEHEKLDYFPKTRGIEPAALPAKRYGSTRSGESAARYFVEKYPIFLPESAASSAPVVSFGFVDEGAVTLSGFETFLAGYRALFAALGSFSVVYIGANAARCEGARAIFERLVRGDGGRISDPNLRRILDHFEARQLYEGKEFASFDRARLIRLRNELQEFSGPDHEALYALWSRGGANAISQEMSPKHTPAERLFGTFSSFVLEHCYDFFGRINAY